MSLRLFPLRDQDFLAALFLVALFLVAPFFLAAPFFAAPAFFAAPFLAAPFFAAAMILPPELEWMLDRSPGGPARTGLRS